MHEQLGMADGSPVKIKWCDYDYFKYPWHFHSEYEIVYVIKSSGTRFVGSSIESFTDGDLVLLGSFLPHMFRNDEVYYRNDPDLRVHAITIQFSKDFFSKAIDSYPEFKPVKSLLENARYGICFENNINDLIRKRIKGLLRLSGMPRLLECLHILSLMSKSEHKRMLSDESADLGPVNHGDARIMQVLDKLNRDYYKPVKLKEMAASAHMNEAAFCRYFKEKTGKSLLQYIHELRIGLACKLLLNGEQTVMEICYECGFNSLSHFNRLFKRITQRTPTEYLEAFKQDMRPIIVR